MSGRKEPLFLFTRKFAAQLHAGITVIESLRSLAGMTNDRRMSVCLANIRMAVEGGTTLAEALSRHPSLFDSTYVSVVAVAEATGKLPEALEDLAGLLEAKDRMGRRIRGAMIYPIVVFVFAFALAAGAIAFILPVFSEAFDELGHELPAITRYMLAASDFLRCNGWPPSQIHSPYGP